jgi:hypothetical protein
VSPLAALVFLSTAITAQDQDWRVDRDHPRLLVPARRLRLLQRERERESIRWQQFVSVMSGKEAPPERGFTFALFYLAGGGESYGREAVRWALGSAGDLRQIALVFDWCQPLLAPDEKAALVARLRAGVARDAESMSPAVLRSRLMAAVALAGHVDGAAETVARQVIEDWWRKWTIPALRTGKAVIDQEDFYPLLEIMHVIRDTYEIDLREDFPKYFAQLPAFHLLSHYPAPFPAPENDYRIPVMRTHGEPDRRQAVLSRAAGLSMVAFDTNNLENQFLQGWLIQDRFLMRSPLGIPYEFLWANPYQPGLSYYHMPLIFHDPLGGRLLLRSSWEDDAVWFYQAEGRKQLFRDGRIENLPPRLDQPLSIGATTLVPATAPMKFPVATEDKVVYFLVNLEPSRRYEIEVDDERIREVATDSGGVIELLFPENRKTVVWLYPLGR